MPTLDIKEKSFHGTLAAGGLAGIVEGSIRAGELTLHTVFPGVVLTLIGAFLGGFTGFFLKDLFRTWRGAKPYRGVHHDGWTMGAFLGAVVGTILQVASSSDGANLVIGSIVGAYCGAVCGAFPDEFITPILLRIRAEKHRHTPAEERH
ncbi:hypothetical protein [Pseudodesulfovibrio sp. JC047]|uniref:hypothetical protein n=1 Tax=Pseudodesulfovibrio sp. JC047 TaxID=2683199 RepID=UPI001EF2A498|nr:hypothetical protein [Pseudodesulfovibrio sp. JC047]